MYWKPGLIIFVCLIPFALAYAIWSVRKKKARAVEACVRDLKRIITDIRNGGGIPTRENLRSIRISYPDEGIFEKACEQLDLTFEGGEDSWS